MSLKNLIFGKDPTERIVSIEPQDDHLELFIQDENGEIRSEFVPNKHWILSNKPLNRDFVRLKGDLFYKFGVQFSKREDFLKARNYWKRHDIYSIYDAKESTLVNKGLTYFKGLKIEDVSILSCDIETNGLNLDKDSKVLLITNTFRHKGVVNRKLFSFDTYPSQEALLLAWTAFIRETNPSIITFHNGFSFDFPFLQHCADLANVQLNLGRDGSALKFNNYESKFRVDGSRDLHYKKCHIYGREIIDTMFLAIKYDISRSFESYALKPIIKHLGLEKKDRQFYDASKIKDNYKDPVEWKKIKQYAIEDSDNGLQVFDICAPPFFYLTQSIPKSFQLVGESASGSQINSIMVRSYLQDRHSIPKASEVFHFEGAISNGWPGIYDNCLKWDVNALYPSIMIQHQIYNKIKDPNMNMMKILDYFRTERLKNKQLSIETNSSYYSHLEQSQKIIINSMYGFYSAPGLNFNYPEGAAKITEYGREILKKSILWATGKSYELWSQDNNLKENEKDKI